VVKVVKKDILPLLYNNEEIPEHFKIIQSVIVEMLDKHFNDKELTESDHDKLWFTDAGNADARLAVEAFFEFQEGKRDIRQCAAPDCKKLFIPTPRGHQQKYCSVRCRTRIHKRKMRKMSTL